MTALIRCLAIDDEPLALKQLASYIQKVPYLELAGMCQSAQEAKEIIDNEEIHAIFVDINMPDMSGMDFVKSLIQPPIIVFTTAYADYAIEGYKVKALDYLLKPFGLDAFKEAAEKVKAQFDLEHAADISRVDSDDAVFFKTEHRIVRVSVEDIRYIEGMSEYLKIYIKDKKPLVVLFSMKRMEEELPSRMFMRIHRSYIINLKEIQEVNKSRVIMDADTYLPIGEMYRDQFMSYLNSKFLGK